MDLDFLVFLCCGGLAWDEELPEDPEATDAELREASWRTRAVLDGRAPPGVSGTEADVAETSGGEAYVEEYGRRAGGDGAIVGLREAIN